MDFNQHFSAHFHKTNVILKTATLKAAGWEGVIDNPAVLAAPTAQGYVVDIDNGFVWMFSASRNLFIEVPDRMKSEPVTEQDIHDSFASAIQLAFTGELQANPDWESVLAASLAAYAGTTRTWALANKMQDGGHFVCIRYKGKLKDGLLRPFYFNTGSDLPVSTEDLREYVDLAIENDRKKHPEWFT